MSITRLMNLEGGKVTGVMEAVATNGTHAHLCNPRNAGILYRGEEFKASVHVYYVDGKWSLIGPDRREYTYITRSGRDVTPTMKKIIAGEMLTTFTMKITSNTLRDAEAEAIQARADSLREKVAEKRAELLKLETELFAELAKGAK